MSLLEEFGKKSRRCCSTQCGVIGKQLTLSIMMADGRRSCPDKGMVGLQNVERLCDSQGASVAWHKVGTQVYRTSNEVIHNYEPRFCRRW